MAPSARSVKPLASRHLPWGIAEGAGLKAPVSRDARCHRRYATTTVEWVNLLQRLRELGMTISEIRACTDLLRDGEASTGVRLAVLRARQNVIHDQLLKLGKTLRILDTKLDSDSEANAMPEPSQPQRSSLQ